MISDNNNKEHTAIEKLNIDKMKDLLHKTSIVAWDHKMNPSKLERWLSNFKGAALGDAETEKKIALWILLNFTFYTLEEVKELCRVIYGDYLHQKITEYSLISDFLEYTRNEKILHIIRNTVFVALGNPSESGSNLLYPFRQANDLETTSFEFHCDLHYENIVLIDDVTISGTQVTTYLKSTGIKANKLYITTFFATQKAIDKIKEKYPDIIVLPAILLDERTKCFSNTSYVFPSSSANNFAELAKKLCEHYGQITMENYPCEEYPYMKSYPLGFKNDQQLFGFYYNTPNNTLPIIWANVSGWFPAFTRHEKTCSQQGGVIDEQQYI